MDAKTLMLEYAAKHNDGNIYTNEQWCGKLACEGVRLDQYTTARATREGQTIIITETTTRDSYDFAKMAPCKTVVTAEVMRINL